MNWLRRRILAWLCVDDEDEPIAQYFRRKINEDVAQAVKEIFEITEEGSANTIRYASSTKLEELFWTIQEHTKLAASVEAHIKTAMGDKLASEVSKLLNNKIDGEQFIDDIVKRIKDKQL